MSGTDEVVSAEHGNVLLVAKAVGNGMVDVELSDSETEELMGKFSVGKDGMLNPSGSGDGFSSELKEADTGAKKSHFELSKSVKVGDSSKRVAVAGVAFEYNGNGEGQVTVYPKEWVLANKADLRPDPRKPTGGGSGGIGGEDCNT